MPIQSTASAPGKYEAQLSGREIPRAPDERHVVGAHLAEDLADTSPGGDEAGRSVGRGAARAPRSLEVHLPRVPEEHGSTEGPQRLGVRPDVIVLEPVDDRLVGSAAPAHDRDRTGVGDALQLGDGHGTVPSLVEVQHSQASELGLHRGDLIVLAIGGERGVGSGPVGLIDAPRYAPRSGTGGGVGPTGTAGTDAGGGTEVAGGTDGRVGD